MMIKTILRRMFGVKYNMLDIRTVDINAKILVWDEQRFKEFLHVIENEYILLLRRWKMNEANAMDSLYWKMNETFDSLHWEAKKVITDPLMKMQNEMKKMVENNSLDN